MRFYSTYSLALSITCLCIACVIGVLFLFVPPLYLSFSGSRAQFSILCLLRFPARVGSRRDAQTAVVMFLGRAIVGKIFSTLCLPLMPALKSRRKVPCERSKLWAPLPFFLSLFERTENQVPSGRLNPVHAAHKLLSVMISKKYMERIQRAVIEQYLISKCANKPYPSLLSLIVPLSIGQLRNYATSIYKTTATAMYPKRSALIPHSYN